MKMKPGDYILKQDIPDEETHERIREAIRNMGYRTNPGIGEWSKRNYVQHNALAVIGEQALWISSGMCEGRRLFPANILSDDKPQGHPAADLLAEIAEVARTHPEPWREFEWWSNLSSIWVQFVTLGDLMGGIMDGDHIRRKPRTITINGHEVPEPVREPLDIDQEYYFPSFTSTGYVKGTWNGDVVDHYRLASGMIHFTRDAVIAHSEALISFTKRED